MLAGDVKHLAGLDAFEDLAAGVELLGFRQMREVARMQDKVRSLRQGVDAGNGFLQGSRHIAVRALAEANMAVAYLQESESVRFRRDCFAHDAERVGNATRNGPQHDGFDPSHAFQHFAAADAVITIASDHCASDD